MSRPAGGLLSAGCDPARSERGEQEGVQDDSTSLASRNAIFVSVKRRSHPTRAERAAQLVAQRRRERPAVGAAGEHDRPLKLRDVLAAVVADGQVRLEPGAVVRAERGVEVLGEHLDELLAHHVVGVDHGRLLTVTSRQPPRPLRHDIRQQPDALHRIAEEVVSPARVAATGNEIALEVTPGGCGTPAFPDGGQVRVEGTELVRRAADGTETREPLAARPRPHRAARPLLRVRLERARDAPRRGRRAVRDPSLARALRHRLRGPGGHLRRLAGRRAPRGAVSLRRARGRRPSRRPEWNAVGFKGAEAPWTDEAGRARLLPRRRDALSWG